MIKRCITLPKDNSFFLFGPRQTGKTTLLRELFPAESTYYYDLLKTDEHLRLLSHPELLREEVTNRPSRITHVIIDEIQKVPMLLDEVHWLLENPGAPCFVLSGSSARKLKRSQADLLAGRAFTLRLFPLTSAELGERFSLAKALRFGTLPKVYLEESEEDAAERLRSYVQTYLKEEVEIEAQVRSLGRFSQFLTLSGFENGNVVNFSNIARETATSYQTVKSYFQILDDTLLGFFLYPYAKSVRKRLSRHPKFYFFDAGVTRALTRRLTVPVEPHTPDYGRAFEHFTILEAVSRAAYRRNDYAFSFYRTESGAEVDLIVETPRGEIHAVEIKASDSVDTPHFRGLFSFAEACPGAKLSCACLAPRRRRTGGVEVVPWQELPERLGM